MFQILHSSSFTYSRFNWVSDFATCMLGVAKRRENAALRKQKSTSNMKIKGFVVLGVGLLWVQITITPLNKSFSDSCCSLTPTNWFWNGQAVFLSVFLLNGFFHSYNNLFMQKKKKSAFVLLLGGCFSFVGLFFFCRSVSPSLCYYLFLFLSW